MVFYGTLAVITSLFAEASEKVKYAPLKLYFSVLTVLVPAFFAGIRYGIGTDYISYQQSFYRIKDGYDSRLEPGYVFLNKVVAFFGGNLEMVLFFSSLIMMVFIYLSLKYYNNYLSVGLGILIFMLVFYQPSFNLVRQSLAVAILLFSFRYIEQRKILKYFIFVFFAASFHLSALIMLPLYFITSLRNLHRKSSRLLLFLLIFLLAINSDKIISPLFSNIQQLERYVSFIESQGSIDGSILLGILMYVPYIGAGLYINIMQNNNNHSALDGQKFFLYFSLFALGILLRTSGYIGLDFAYRIAYNFMIAQVILIPYLYRQLKAYNQNLISIGLVITTIFLWWHSLIYSGYHQTVPYQWIFD